MGTPPPPPPPHANDDARRRSDARRLQNAGGLVVAAIASIALRWRRELARRVCAASTRVAPSARGAQGQGGARRGMRHAPSLCFSSFIARLSLPTFINSMHRFSYGEKPTTSRTTSFTKATRLFSLPLRYDGFGFMMSFVVILPRLAFSATMPNAMPVLVSVLAALPGWPVVPAKRVGADMAAANGRVRQEEVSPRSEPESVWPVPTVAEVLMV